MPNTIIECLYKNKVAQGNEVAFRFLSESSFIPSEVTHSELWQAASEIAIFLKSKMQPKSCVLLLYPSGIEYIKAFYGCLMANMIAVPLYPPGKSNKSDRIAKVALSCQASFALTTETSLDKINEYWSEQKVAGVELEFLTTDNLVVQEPIDNIPSLVETDDVAFLQYTSGSTGAPKGVMISHDNIIGNVTHLSKMASGNSKDVFVNWLPLFHDLGLITAILWPVYLGAPSTLMSPASFVRKPSNWLRAIHKYKGTMCGAPNFAYDLCVNKISEEDRKGLDLSSWRVAYNAAEPVRASTLSRFSDTFKSSGFDFENFYPGYGMAEATVFITGGRAEQAPEMIRVKKESLGRFKIDITAVDDACSTVLVSCGTADSPHNVQIVDPKSRQQLQEGQVGEVWFSGPSVSPGYWQLDEQSKEVFNQGFLSDSNDAKSVYLRTGDLGVLWHNELYITGRIKDLIILRGRNYYPQDIEYSVNEAHEAVRQGYSAAFSIEHQGSEQLVVVTELKREHFRKVNLDEVISSIKQQVFSDNSVNVDAIVLLKPHSIPMTSSGKVQRRGTKHMFINNLFHSLTSTQQKARVIHAPTDEIETKVHDIWSEILEIPKISILDGFYELGGDSIKAIDISVQVTKQFSGLTVDENELLECVNIKDMARYLTFQYKMASSITQRSSSEVIRL